MIYIINYIYIYISCMQVYCGRPIGAGGDDCLNDTEKWIDAGVKGQM